MKQKIISKLIEYDRPLKWLAEQLGISPTTLWRKLDGQNDFKHSEKLAMALLFDVDVTYFEEE